MKMGVVPLTVPPINLLYMYSMAGSSLAEQVFTAYHTPVAADFAYHKFKKYSVQTSYEVRFDSPSRCSLVI